jgi:hypothetical protein
MKADFLPAAGEKHFQKDYIFIFLFFNDLPWSTAPWCPSMASYISESHDYFYKTILESRKEIVKKTCPIISSFLKLFYG